MWGVPKWFQLRMTNVVFRVGEARCSDPGLVEYRQQRAVGEEKIFRIDSEWVDPGFFLLCTGLKILYSERASFTQEPWH
jgi:hypothetical protein